MHKFTYWYEGLIFILVLLVVVAIPCVLIAFLGSRLIYQLGQYPTKSAKANLDMALPVLGSMVLSYGLMWLFMRYFLD